MPATRGNISATARASAGSLKSKIGRHTNPDLIAGAICTSR